MRIASLFLFAAAALAAAADKTNVLFIFSDDLNNNLGCYNHPIVQSPHIDRLASRGVRFDQAYCQYPVCNPSRASVMTGLYPDQTGVMNNRVFFRDNLGDITTLPQMFRNNGYFAARVGKIYHYGVPSQIGENGLDDPASWDEVVNPRGRDKDDEPLIQTIAPHRNFGGTLSWLAADGDDTEQTDGIGASACIRLLEAHKDEPFFIAMGFYRPHTPYVAPKKYFQMYPLDSIRLPDEPLDDLVDIPPAGWVDRPYQLGMSLETKKSVLQAYYASITFLDAQLGRILDALDRLDLRRNTIVIFVSDHGYHMGEHVLWQKTTLFEDSCRVPLIVSAPGFGDTAGRATTAVTELIDLYPTLADLCGIQPPSHLAGRSLRPNLQDPTAPGKATALTVFNTLDRVHAKNPLRPPTTGYTIRTNRWRYTEWDGGKYGVELYDHRRDPKEHVNLAIAPALQETAGELRGMLHAAIERARAK
ncbi:MAG: sulfatase [bacterium]|nr:sulfatase [bacterium]